MNWRKQRLQPVHVHFDMRVQKHQYLGKSISALQPDKLGVLLKVVFALTNTYFTLTSFVVSTLSSVASFSLSLSL